LGLVGACRKGLSGTHTVPVQHEVDGSRLYHRDHLFIVAPETLKVRGVGGDLESMVTNGEEIASALRQWTQGKANIRNDVPTEDEPEDFRGGT